MQAQKRGMPLRLAVLAATLGDKTYRSGGRFQRVLRRREVELIQQLDLAPKSALGRLRGLKVITDESYCRVVVTVLGKGK